MIQENLTGIRVVRAFARQEFECEKFAARNAEFRERGRVLLNVLADFWALSDVLCLSQVGLTLIAGAWWLIRGDIDVGTLFTFVSFVWTCFLMTIPCLLMRRVTTREGEPASFSAVSKRLYICSPFTLTMMSLVLMSFCSAGDPGSTCRMTVSEQGRRPDPVRPGFFRMRGVTTVFVVLPFLE